MRYKYDRNVVTLYPSEGAGQVRQLDRNVFTPYANDAMRMRIFGDQNVGTLHEQNAPRECASATVMSLHDDQQRQTAIAP